MKVLFLTIGQIDLSQSNVYVDLVYALNKEGHQVSVIYSCEKRFDMQTNFREENGVKLLGIKVGNLTKCGKIEKAVSMFCMKNQFIHAIKKYLKNETYDLIIYSTPPITFANVVSYCKKFFHAKTYLMLKDIFPQNAVDLGMISKRGLSGLIYRYYRNIEQKLYRISDGIGCMSPANIQFLYVHNPILKDKNIHLFPNSILLRKESEKNVDTNWKLQYKIPNEALIFLYGGNLGKPQGMDFLAEAIDQCKSIEQAFFVIVGSGTEKQSFIQKVSHLANVNVLSAISALEFDMLCSQCDVGLISLDYRFTIPNFPSRILSYLNNSLPIFSCTDDATDVPKMIEEADCGYSVLSNEVQAFVCGIKWFIENRDELEKLGTNGKKYAETHFDVFQNVKILENFIRE